MSISPLSGSLLNVHPRLAHHQRTGAMPSPKALRDIMATTKKSKNQLQMAQLLEEIMNLPDACQLDASSRTMDGLTTRSLELRNTLTGKIINSYRVYYSPSQNFSERNIDALKQMRDYLQRRVAKLSKTGQAKIVPSTLKEPAGPISKGDFKKLEQPAWDIFERLLKISRRTTHK